ncbi:MAG: hypothetical protein KatS3mg043_1654 [Rhodothermaceae bacterium]|nr:MAG: hypothetical protein KatS3mg043_1654 [Rhodothermaceae bacterium]
MPPSSTYRIQTLVDDVRRRWRRRALLQGGAVAVLVLLFFATALLLLHTRLGAPPGVLAVVALLGLVALVAVVVRLVVRPGLQRLSDRQIALFIEEKMPDLQDRLNSAIEVNADGTLRRTHPALLDRLVDDAAQQVRAIAPATLIDRQRARLLAFAAAGAATLFLLLGYTALDDLRLAFLGAGRSVFAADVPFMTVSPGNAEVEQGGTQEVIVAFRSETGREPVLHFREGDGPWQEATMTRGADATRFLHAFLDIQASIRYFVTHGDLRSETYTLALYEFPAVRRIDLRYDYPAYTGLPARLEEDTGDIEALRGTTVTLTVHTSGTVETAEVVRAGGDRLPLTPLGDGRYQGRLTVDAPDTYLISLTDRQGKQNKFPEEYRIEPLDDEKPLITITDPQRDVRANAVDEVRVAVTVTDDYGVQAVRLRYHVNGGEEQVVTLAEPGRRQATGPRDAARVQAEHLFFLEDFSLEPGDVIAYHVEATDGRPGGEAEVTDLYFIEIIPFDQQFRQAANAGGMPGPPQSGIVLSQQQIIAATWNLQRRRGTMTDEAFAEAARGLVQAQRTLQTSIEERIGNTAFSLELRASERGRQIVEHLRAAVTAMKEAVTFLEKPDPAGALPPEQRALNHLLKADALNEERQVALNRNGQAGGAATEERMTELMDLELDIDKDKYELRQENPSGGGNPALDETLRKVQELARRQERLMNQTQAPQAETDRRREVERLRREQDELQQQTRQLAARLQQQQRNGTPGAGAARESLERALERMDEADDALRRGDVQQAMARQQQALNELDRLRDHLRQEGNENLRERLQRLARGLEDLRQQERTLGRRLDETRARLQAGAGITDADLDPLREQRQTLRETLGRLEREAEDLERQSRNRHRDLATALRNLTSQARRDGLDRLLMNSQQALEQGWLDYADRLQDEIEQALDRLDTRRLADHLPVTEEERLARSLDDVRRLRERLDALRPNGQDNPQAGHNPDGNGRPGRADAARIRRHLEQARETLQRLGRNLDGNPGLERPLRELQTTLADLSHTGIRLEGDAARAFFDEKVFAPLSRLEQALERELDALDLDRKLFGARKDDVPPRYRSLVEKYYETLAKTKN